MSSFKFRYTCGYSDSKTSNKKVNSEWLGFTVSYIIMIKSQILAFVVYIILFFLPRCSRDHTFAFIGEEDVEMSILRTGEETHSLI